MGALPARFAAARDETKALGEAVTDIFNAARDCMASDLLSAVNLLADDNPEFVKGFKQATRQDDRRGGQGARKPKDNPPA